MEGIRRDTRQVVERLEGQVARLRAAVWILFLALLAAAGAFLWQRRHPKTASGPGTLTVKGLTVEDEGGAGRVLITGQGLSVMDGQGQPCAILSLDANGRAQLQLKDAQGVQTLQAGPSSVALTDGKKDAAVMTTAGGSTIQLHRGDKVVFKQPWDAPDLK